MKKALLVGMVGLLALSVSATSSNAAGVVTKTDKKISSATVINPDSYSNETETNDSFAAANSLNVTYLQGKIGTMRSATDIDNFYFLPNTNGFKEFRLLSIPPNCDYDLYVYDQMGNMLASSNAGPGADEDVFVDVTANQKIYVQVVVYDVGYDPNYSYILQSL